MSRVRHLRRQRFDHRKRGMVGNQRRDRLVRCIVATPDRQNQITAVGQSRWITEPIGRHKAFARERVLKTLPIPLSGFGEMAGFDHRRLYTIGKLRHHGDSRTRMQWHAILGRGCLFRMNEPVITLVQTAADAAAAKALFLEYADQLDFPLCFQGFDREMATFPEMYAPPRGTLLLACHGGDAVGTVGIRALTADVCEMKRLYVRTDARRFGLGRALAEAALLHGCLLGYRAMRLDTIRGRQDAAIALYHRLGFREIPPYYANPIPEALYLERTLTAPGTSTGTS